MTKSISCERAIAWTQQPQVSWISPIWQICTSAGLSVDNRVFVSAELRHQDRVGLGLSWCPTLARVKDRSRDLHHCGCDAEGAVPCALRTSVTGSLRGAGFRGVGYGA